MSTPWIFTPNAFGYMFFNSPAGGPPPNPPDYGPVDVQQLKPFLFRNLIEYFTIHRLIFKASQSQYVQSGDIINGIQIELADTSAHKLFWLVCSDISPFYFADPSAGGAPEYDLYMLICRTANY